MARPTATQTTQHGTTPARFTARLTEQAHERGARLTVAARDARTIAGMLDNHDRPHLARLLVRWGDRGERVGRHLSETNEPELRRAAAVAAAGLTALVVARRLLT